MSLFFYSIHQSPPIAKFVYEIIVVPSLEVIFVFDDEFTWSDGRKGFDFIDRALLEEVILLKFLDGDDFDCELPHFLGVQGSIDLTVIALPNFLD